MTIKGNLILIHRLDIDGLRHHGMVCVSTVVYGEIFLSEDLLFLRISPFSFN